MKASNSTSVADPAATDAHSDRINGLLREHAELERDLADSAVHTDAARARRLGRRYAELGPIVATVRELDSARGDRETAAELAEEDASFAAETQQLDARIGELETRLRELLVPRDPSDAKDVILEIKAGEGGEESALFAGDLLRMYTRYAERHGWKTEIIDVTESDLGGYKDAALAVKSKSGAGLDGVWSRLKYEGGVHRVQRVPVTESQGRIHTSAAGVMVMPAAEDV
ncbi:MAG: PCRF domain-containing protein, partial [Mycobacteriales bacterium]